MTALQLLIQDFGSMAQGLNENELYDYFMKRATELLELEKQQFIDAYIGYNSIREHNLPFAEQYYNETYNK